MSDNSLYNLAIEWEVIDMSQFADIICTKKIMSLPHNSTITFTRSYNYKLTFEIFGTAASEDELRGINRIDGTSRFIEDEVITGTDGFFAYELHGATLKRYSPSIVSLNPFHARYVGELTGNKVIKKRTFAPRPTSTLYEWFLCPDIETFFPRSTSRKVYEVKIRTREEADLVGGAVEIQRPKTSQGGRDHLLVKMDTFKFAFAKVPEKLGPEWSYNHVIEYRGEWGIPSERTRNAVSELISFLVGAQLVYIGTTGVDSGNYIQESIYQAPWLLDPRQACKTVSLPVFNIKHNRNTTRLENVLTELLPKYLEVRDTYNLDGVISNFFVSQTTYLGTDLPILAACIEELAHNYFACHSSYKSAYIEFDAFGQLINAELESISQKLGNLPQKERILKNIRKACYKSGSDKVQSFFNAIGLNVSKLEEDAMMARNKMAHTTRVPDDDAKVKKLIKLCWAYRTLFNRVILKLLGYQGTYIDYYTDGFPERNIDEPIPKV